MWALRPCVSVDCGRDGVGAACPGRARVRHGKSEAENDGAVPKVGRREEQRYSPVRECEQRQQYKQPPRRRRVTTTVLPVFACALACLRVGWWLRHRFCRPSCFLVNVVPSIRASVGDGLLFFRGLVSNGPHAPAPAAHSAAGTSALQPSSPQFCRRDGHSEPTNARVVTTTGRLSHMERRQRDYVRVRTNGRQSPPTYVIHASPPSERTHTHTHARTHAHAHHTHTHTHTHTTHTRTRTHAQTHTYTHAHTHTHTHTRARTHAHTCTRTRIHVHTHSRTHTDIHTRSAHARMHAHRVTRAY